MKFLNVVILTTCSVQTSIPFVSLAFDIVIFGLTLRKTFDHAVEMKRLGESSITQVILLDGTSIKSNGKYTFVSYI